MPLEIVKSEPLGQQAGGLRIVKREPLMATSPQPARPFQWAMAPPLSQPTPKAAPPAFVGPQRPTPYQEQVSAMGGMPPLGPTPMQAARAAAPPPKTVVGRGGGLLSKTDLYTETFGKQPTMAEVMRPALTGNIEGVLRKPESQAEAVQNAVARTAAGFLSAQGLATMLAAGGIGNALKAAAQSPKVAVLLRNAPEVQRGIDLASKTAIPATFGGMGAYGAGQEIKAATEAETAPEMTEALVGALSSGLIAVAGTAGVIKGAREPFHPWRVSEVRPRPKALLAEPPKPPAERPPVQQPPAELPPPEAKVPAVRPVPLEAPVEAKPVEAVKPIPLEPQPSAGKSLKIVESRPLPEAEPTAPAKPAAKQPWEMTREEWAAANPREWYKGSLKKTRDPRELIVEKALREGKPVPPEVLADYPDLAKPEAALKGFPDSPTPPTPAPSPTDVKEDIQGITTEMQGAERYYDSTPEQRAESFPKIMRSLKPGESAADTAFAKGWMDEYRRATASAKPASVTLGTGLGGIQFGGQKKPLSPKHTFDDPGVEKNWQAAVKEDPTTFQRLGQAWTSIKENTTRTYKHLPRGKEFGPAIFKLKRLEAARHVTAHRAVEGLDGIVGLMKQDINRFDLFTRKVVMNDLKEQVDMETAEDRRWDDMPYGWDQDSFLAQYPKTTAAAEADPVIAEAIQRRRTAWQALRDLYIPSMKRAGYDVEPRLQREEYYHRIIIEYDVAKQMLDPKRGRKLRTPTGSAHLKRRTGQHAKTISRDYLRSEFEVMSQMLLDIEKNNTIEFIRAPANKLNIAPQVKAELKAINKERKEEGLEPETLEGLIKKEHEGYVTWQPREGNHFWMAQSIPEKLAAKIMASNLGEIVTDKDVREILAKGRKLEQLVIKEELAATLDGMGKEHALAERVLNRALVAWKQWQLISPFRYLKYNLRNLTGDSEMAYLGNPKGFSKLPQSFSDLRKYYKTGEMTPSLRQWFLRGGLQTLLQAQEMGELKPLQALTKLGVSNKPGMVKRGWQAYWRKARVSTDFREALLRYANHLHYWEQMQRSGGRPDNFGASIPEEVMALRDSDDRAFKLSNDLLGAYDEISVAGQMLRRDLIPFWSFQELTLRRYHQLALNAARDKKMATLVGRKLLGGAAMKTPYTAYRIGALAIKIAALWGILSVTNHFLAEDEEEEVPKDVKARPHLTFPMRGPNGEVRYFTRMGTSSDMVEWLGWEDTGPELAAILNGERTLKEIAAASLFKNPVVNKFWQSAGPHIKLPAELITGYTTYPDISRPRKIRDRLEHVFRQMALQGLYRRATGKPVEPTTIRSVAEEPLSALWDVASKLALYETDPGQSAYWDIQDEKRRYLKSIGKWSEGWSFSARAKALYHIKESIRYGDETAFDKYRTEYRGLGGSPENIQQSLNRLDPMGGLNKQQQAGFYRFLDEDGKQKLEKARQYYRTVLVGGLSRATAPTLAPPQRPPMPSAMFPLPAARETGGQIALQPPQ